MATVTLQQAQLSLVELIRGLSPGGELMILDNERPVAKLSVPSVPEPRPPRFGTLRGTVLSMEHFDDPLEDFEDYR